MAEKMQRSYSAPVFEPFQPPKRLLLGPGPSPVDDRVLQAMAGPVLGHLDPAFLKCMDDIKEMLRYAFQTSNKVTFPISGTGSLGMEACLVNLIEPGDHAVVGLNGYFSERMREMITRAGGNVVPVTEEWGKPIDPNKIEEALKLCNPRVLAVVQAETSTGVLQDLTGLADLAHRYGALLVVDAVTSLGTTSVSVDKNEIDASYSCSQKGIGAPPGLAPVTFSDRALERIRSRKRKVQSWYLDVTTIEGYWSGDRTYHHTAPISMNYALREALRLLCEEGLESRFRRHELNHRAFAAGVEAMGLALHVAPENRLPAISVFSIPEGVSDAKVRARLLEEQGIEISGGLGALKGKAWRVGLMGFGSTKDNVLFLLDALHKALGAEGLKMPSGVDAAQRIYSASK